MYESQSTTTSWWPLLLVEPLLKAGTHYLKINNAPVLSPQLRSAHIFNDLCFSCVPMDAVIKILRDNVITPSRSGGHFHIAAYPSPSTKIIRFSSQSPLRTCCAVHSFRLGYSSSRHPKRIAFLEFYYVSHAKFHVASMHHRTCLRISKIPTSSFHHIARLRIMVLVWTFEPFSCWSKFAVKATLIAVVQLACSFKIPYSVIGKIPHSFQRLWILTKDWLFAMWMKPPERYTG